ncbi:ribosome-inactivating family protein [Streptomyces sp. NPDC050121]|uniref:ribosome-inactivating family protein n=1 Tax=Streptomyces sp. NPDC050121 TaxID=3365601 RepID=UPI0037A2D480
MAALVLALIATLVGPMGTVQSARANDGNPMFRVGEHFGYDYIEFINDIRRRVNDGHTSQVPGAGNTYQVQHTNPNSVSSYLQVDIQMWGSSHFVRLQLRRSDLYVLGWWDRNNNYRYLGSRTVTRTSAEAQRMEDGENRPPDAAIRASFQEDYPSLETAAHERRANMPISRDSISAAAWYLYDSNDTQNMARGVLRMIQFVAEATRFRPLRDSIATVIGTNGVYSIPPLLAAQENQWGRLSGRFNWLLGFPQGYRDPHPLTAYRRDVYGSAVAIVLYTAIQYAQYVLGTSKGRN